MNTIGNINLSPVSSLLMLLVAWHRPKLLREWNLLPGLLPSSYLCPQNRSLGGTGSQTLWPPQGFSKPSVFICHSGETLWTLEVKEIAFLLATNLEQNSNRFLYCFSLLPEWALSTSHMVGREATSCHYPLYKGCRSCTSCSQLSLTFFLLMGLLALLCKRIFWLSR